VVDAGPVLDINAKTGESSMEHRIL
jgi:hypothetical protein